MAGLLELVQGSAHDLSFLADGSVHAAITSPPYFGLRSYAGDQEIDWPAVSYAPMVGLPPVTVPAVRCALGAEADPFAYVGHLILCLREWWRVLRDDGVCLVNLGDSYANDAKWGGTTGGKHAEGLHGAPVGRLRKSTGLKPKDLIMIPARFALAAQADGWYLRAGIVWAKGVSFLADYAGSSMPESVKDRPARSHEDIYLLAKRERYFWDYLTVREEAVRGVVWTGKQGTFEPRKKDEPDRPGQSAGVHREGRDRRVESGRNLRSVWVINPRPFSAAHFACWPETLVDPMVRAATSERGVCPACGAPWVRVVERGLTAHDGSTDSQYEKGSSANRMSLLRQAARERGEEYQNQAVTVGWLPSCGCGAPDPVPAVVLDPFSGSATTGKVCARLGRRYIGVDLASEYLGAVTDARMGDGVQMELV